VPTGDVKKKYKNDPSCTTAKENNASQLSMQQERKKGTK
jgi:hypothetical protein